MKTPPNKERTKGDVIIGNDVDLRRCFHLLESQ